MLDPLISAIKAIRKNKSFFVKFVSANDAGSTGAHQGGLYIPKTAFNFLFDLPGQKGINKEKNASVKWSDGTLSDCRCIYYGKGSRNEYRMTRLGKHLEVGKLVVMVKVAEDKYNGFLLEDERDIEIFLLCFNLKKKDTNTIINI
jgi:hypothetical protein